MNLPLCNKKKTNKLGPKHNLMSDNKAKVPSNISGQESSVCNLIRSGNSRKMISMGTWKNETQRQQMKITTLAPDYAHGRTLQIRTGRSTPKSKVTDILSQRPLCEGLPSSEENH